MKTIDPNAPVSANESVRAESKIPLWPVGDDGRCTCGQPECRRPGKHPARNAPGPGYVFETGAASGLIVIDVDVKAGVDGYAQLEDLESQLGELPPTFTVRTSSGGAHFYLRHPGGERINGKLASAIDLKGDKERDDGFVYVVGAGSPGYTKTVDPCVVTPGDAYTVERDVPVAAIPEKWLAYMRAITSGTARKAVHAPTPVEPSDPEWSRRVAMAIEAAKTMPESRGDGEGGKRLFALAIKLVRKLELPLDVAHDIIVEHFNPRCTHPDGRKYPWSPEEVDHKLEDARDRSDIPCGILSEATVEGYKAVGARASKPPALRDLVPSNAVTRKVPDPNHVYAYRVGEMASRAGAEKKPFNELIQVFSRGKEWEGCWQYDEFADAVRCVNPPIRLDAEKRGVTPSDHATLRAWLDHNGILATEKDIAAAVEQAAKALRYHPVREYLASLPAGEPSIFRGLGKRVFGTDERLADEFLEKTMVAAVRRILSPGCQVDTVLVLVGEEQGEGKTTTVCELFGWDWTRRNLPMSKGLTDRDAAHALVGFWAVELGELVSLTKATNEEAKDFLSKTDDPYREFGSGARVRRKRENIFIGTTNDGAFLRDYRNRRYWPIQIPAGHVIPRQWVREHRDALWAAALTLAKDETYKHWYDKDEEQALEKYRSAFLELDGWYDVIRAYCAGKTFVRADDAFVLAIGGRREDFDNKAKRRIEDTLFKLGCRRGKEPVERKRDGPDNRKRGWLVPADLAAEPEQARPRPVPLRTAGT